MTSDKAVLLKHYRDLARTISSFSNDQACLKELADDEDLDLETVFVTVSPNDGPYRGGKFDFEFDLSDGYPTCPPVVRCQTHIYHPNIDFCDDQGDVCLNLLDELWTPDMTLEDVVQGVLFLLYNPNVEDPLSSMFTGNESEEQFLENVRASLRGESVDGEDFERNLADGYESDVADSDDGETNKCTDDLIQAENNIATAVSDEDTRSETTVGVQTTLTDTQTTDTQTTTTTTVITPLTTTTSIPIAISAPTAVSIPTTTPAIDVENPVTSDSNLFPVLPARAPSVRTPSIAKLSNGVESSVDKENPLLIENGSITNLMFAKFWTAAKFWPAVAGYVSITIGTFVARFNYAVNSRTSVYTDVDVHR